MQGPAFSERRACYQWWRTQGRGPNSPFMTPATAGRAGLDRGCALLLIRPLPATSHSNAFSIPNEKCRHVIDD